MFLFINVPICFIIWDLNTSNFNNFDGDNIILKKLALFFRLAVSSLKLIALA